MRSTQTKITRSSKIGWLRKETNQTKFGAMNSEQFSEDINKNYYYERVIDGKKKLYRKRYEAV